MCGGRECVVCGGGRECVVWGEGGCCVCGGWEVWCDVGVCGREREVVIEKGKWGWGEEEVYIAYLIYIINTLNSSHDYSEI